ncbi:uncharacterized protein BDR25DRAFT_370309, partial [Lindgomyces ingoldianus]
MPNSLPWVMDPGASSSYGQAEPREQRGQIQTRSLSPYLDTNSISWSASPIRHSSKFQDYHGVELDPAMDAFFKNKQLEEQAQAEAIKKSIADKLAKSDQNLKDIKVMRRDTKTSKIIPYAATQSITQLAPYFNATQGELLDVIKSNHEFRKATGRLQRAYFSRFGNAKGPNLQTVLNTIADDRRQRTYRFKGTLMKFHNFKMLSEVKMYASTLRVVMFNLFKQANGPFHSHSILETLVPKRAWNLIKCFKRLGSRAKKRAANSKPRGGNRVTADTIAANALNPEISRVGTPEAHARLTQLRRSGRAKAAKQIKALSSKQVPKEYAVHPTEPEEALDVFEPSLGSNSNSHSHSDLDSKSDSDSDS